MKSTKDIREQYDLITEKEEAETNKLSALVRAGLFDAKKLPALKKALEKSSDKMTSQEKRMLLNLLDSLISQVTSDEQIYRKVKHNVHGMNEEKKMDTFSKYDPRYEKGFPSDKDLPSVLILKRKAIRVYPDNQKVALYYSQALDKYVTIPYNDIQVGLNEDTKLIEETSEERKKRIAASLAGGSRTRKMLKTGKVLPSEKSLKSKVGAAVKNISDVSKRSGKSIAAGVATGKLFKAALKAPLNAIRVKKTEKKLQDRLARRKETKLVARRKEVNDLTKTKRQEVKTKETKATKPTPVSAPAAPKVTTKPAVSAKSEVKIRKSSAGISKEPKKNVVAAAPPKRRSPEATANRKAKIAAKTVNEDFKRNLQIIREARQYGAADAAADAASFIPGPAGSVASLASAGLSLSRGDYVGAALDAAGALPVVGYAAKAAKLAKAAKGVSVAGKVVSRGSKLTRAARTAGKVISKAAKVAGVAADASSGTSNTEKNDSSHILSKGANPQFGKSALFKSNSGFSKTTDAETATQERARQAQVKALTTEQGNPYILSRGADPQFGRLKTNTSRSNRRSNLNAARDERIRQKQLAALTNESVIDTIKNMVINNIQEVNLNFNENKITINNTVAKKLLTVYESINKTNKKKMEQMLNESATSFNKVLKFAVRQ